MHKRPLWVLLVSAFLLYNPLLGQAPKVSTSADVYRSIEQLNFLGSVLYVAAHPDDENTRLISYFANQTQARTAYLSLTRGDGGQNLIGTETNERLGILRTQELLAARRTDGGHQFFSRAYDFGFSKHPDETLRIWDKDAVLSDVVWAIRQWQPDIIINRFEHTYDTRWDGRMHGHHTASATLALEAYTLAADPKAYPEQLKHVPTWQASRHFFNTSSWFYGSREAFEKADKSDLVTVNVGVYYPWKGKSNTEIAAEARSMHKCQGFGSAGTRGDENEYLKLLKGNMPKDQTNPFEGINTTWSRVKGGEPVGVAIKKILTTYKHADPAASIPALVQVHAQIQKLPDGYWKRVKLEELEHVIRQCAGLFLEASTSIGSVTPSDSLAIRLEAVNRSPVAIQLQQVQLLPLNEALLTAPTTLNNNKALIQNTRVQIPATMRYSTPYWLYEPRREGSFVVSDQLLRGTPDSKPALQALARLTIAGVPMQVIIPVVYKRVDPAKGELFAPLEVIHAASVDFTESVYVFTSEKAQDIKVQVQAGKDNISGVLQLEVPSGWQITPKEIPVSLGKKGQIETYTFNLTPTPNPSQGTLHPRLRIGDQTYTMSIKTVAYDHIPTQTIQQEASAVAVRVDMQKKQRKVAYIMGAGDNVAAAIRQMGYEVTEINDVSTMTADDFSVYGVVVLGVRLYNVREDLPLLQPKLMDYVRNGGTLIAQYNTSGSTKLKDREIGPLPFTIGRERVTDETAAMRLLLPDHPLLNTPNKITAADFEGWVQEHGLYYTKDWDPAYKALLSSNDPNEPPRDGSLIVAPYGKGTYIYTSLSWFRQLPSGVPGAFRLFANLLSAGENQQ